MQIVLCCKLNSPPPWRGSCGESTNGTGGSLSGSGGKKQTTLWFCNFKAAFSCVNTTSNSFNSQAQWKSCTWAADIRSSPLFVGWFGFLQETRRSEAPWADRTHGLEIETINKPDQSRVNQDISPQHQTTLKPNNNYSYNLFKTRVDKSSPEEPELKHLPNIKYWHSQDLVVKTRIVTFPWHATTLVILETQVISGLFVSCQFCFLTTSNRNLAPVVLLHTKESRAEHVLYSSSLRF